MKITALEIKQHEFEKSFRGYNIEEVDIFLNSLANEWERTSNEARMLRMQLEIAEKEAAKLREVEMSLIKTLQTAENTSNKITEQAKIQAEREIEQAQLQAENILIKARKEAEITLNSARQDAENILTDAQKEATEITAKAKIEVSEGEKKMVLRKENLEKSISELESHKTDLVNQLKALTSNTLNKLESLGATQQVETIKIQPVVPEVVIKKEDPAPVIEEIPAKEIEEENKIQGFASSANTLVLEDEEKATVTKSADDLTLIEGIGPKIDELLKNNGVKTFRDLAVQPAYKIKELLASAGPSYSMHDPGTWAEQAKLADSERWEELDELKIRLVAGREVENSLIDKSDNQATGEQSTEEMLDRVNKVKAALKKAMQEKAATETPKPSEPKNDTGGSFFDNL